MTLTFMPVFSFYLIRVGVIISKLAAGIQSEGTNGFIRFCPRCKSAGRRDNEAPDERSLPSCSELIHRSVRIMKILIRHHPNEARGAFTDLTDQQLQTQNTETFSLWSPSGKHGWFSESETSIYTYKEDYLWHKRCTKKAKEAYVIRKEQK